MRLSFDSNILVYAADRDAGKKHAMAVDLLDRASDSDCILTLQSLTEFFRAVTQKGKRTPTEAAGFVNDWLAIFPVFAADERCLTGAIEAVRQHTLAFWDAMLWSTARQANCRLLLTEDLHDGQTIGGVTFVNPFAAKNATLIEAALPRP